MLLVRHGESTWNVEHRIQGQLDPPLSEQGRRQAERVGRRLAGRRLVGFYSSDLKRAFETAQAIEAATGLEAEPTPGLREIYLGEWEGLHSEEVAQRYPDVWAKWSYEGGDWDIVPGGEGASAFAIRVAAALDAIFEHHEHGDVLVVTHGGVIQMMLNRVVGRTSHGLFLFKIQNASITVIEKRRGRLIIGGVNDTSHLDTALVTEPGPG
ncbi:MAG TPA: histidine phosphatase family protein [Candidatus Dormibacteraeota bacterium]